MKVAEESLDHTTIGELLEEPGLFCGLQCIAEITNLEHEAPPEH